MAKSANCAIANKMGLEGTVNLNLNPRSPDGVNKPEELKSQT